MRLENEEDRKRECKIAELLDLYLTKEGFTDFDKTECPLFHTFDYRYYLKGRPWFWLEIKTRSEKSAEYDSLLLEAKKYDIALVKEIPVKVIVQWKDCTMSFTLREGYNVIEKEITHPKTKEKKKCRLVEIPFSDGRKLW